MTCQLVIGREFSLSTTAFTNNNTFSGYLHSMGEVQLSHLSLLNNMHLLLLLK